LMVKRASVGHWDEWVRLERPRLKTARLAAYDAALLLAAANGSGPNESGINRLDGL